MMHKFATRWKKKYLLDMMRSNNTDNRYQYYKFSSKNFEFKLIMSPKCHWIVWRCLFASLPLIAYIYIYIHIHTHIYIYIPWTLIHLTKSTNTDYVHVKTWIWAFKKHCILHLCGGQLCNLLKYICRAKTILNLVRPTQHPAKLDKWQRAMKYVFRAYLLILCKIYTIYMFWFYAQILPVFCYLALQLHLWARKWKWTLNNLVSFSDQTTLLPTFEIGSDTCFCA
jgi:hypothetical protein